MERLIRNGEKVEMEVDIAVKFESDRKIYNVIAEIPGTDPKLKDELVIIGGHLDCYHMSPGAGDDGAGFIAMLEAMRILKAIGVQPRRTIRVAFWGGEEVGLHGSSGYVEQFVQDPVTKEMAQENSGVYLPRITYRSIRSLQTGCNLSWIQALRLFPTGASAVRIIYLSTMRVFLLSNLSRILWSGDAIRIAHRISPTAWYWTIYATTQLSSPGLLIMQQ